MFNSIQTFNKKMFYSSQIYIYIWFLSNILEVFEIILCI